ncbi:hypothetical protein JCM10914A_55860 [Paenibacillus sp. JCM 10914]|uniref:hypothetical protein n=1 Tax=Paenibacillus sp. JCM 10914 TaxID=1236974 RepID=UPI0003CC7032|nr:hypothetical protein [Paenibacillus sp. JCM 10914]GAE09611.1 hypothetical protein JCM10914_5981 [Paenibacillus sp. JCM 10914]
MDKKNDGISVTLSVNTDLLSLKLRAIAKHATALADDLDKIDEATCSECGGPLDEMTLYAEKIFEHKEYVCNQCGHDILKNG